jgi:type VI secretion system ImpM family protein
MELSLSDRPLGRWLFGKLPAHGDFVGRGLRADLRDALDQWLSAGMAEAAARFGDDFEHRYFAAPAWVYVDRDRAGRWSGGALCASVDGVGRKFPVMSGEPADDAPQAVQTAGASLERLYTALAQGWTADRLITAEVPATGLDWQADAPAWALIGEAGPPIVVPGRFPDGVIAAMMEVAA